MKTISRLIRMLPKCATCNVALIMNSGVSAYRKELHFFLGIRTSSTLAFEKGDHAYGDIA